MGLLISGATVVVLLLWHLYETNPKWKRLLGTLSNPN